MRHRRGPTSTKSHLPSAALRESEGTARDALTRVDELLGVAEVMQTESGGIAAVKIDVSGAEPLLLVWMNNEWIPLATVGGTEALVVASAAAAGGGAGGVIVGDPVRRLAKKACVGKQAAYPLGFSPNPARVISASIQGYAMTPDQDFTILGDIITLEDHMVPVITEGYILVEATPL